MPLRASDGAMATSGPPAGRREAGIRGHHELVERLRREIGQVPRQHEQARGPVRQRRCDPQPRCPRSGPRRPVGGRSPAPPPLGSRAASDGVRAHEVDAPAAWPRAEHGQRVRRGGRARAPHAPRHRGPRRAAPCPPEIVRIGSTTWRGSRARSSSAGGSILMVARMVVPGAVASADARQAGRCAARICSARRWRSACVAHDRVPEVDQDAPLAQRAASPSSTTSRTQTSTRPG